MSSSTASEETQDSSLECENLLFDGNRQWTSENPYFNETTRHFNPNNSSLVQNAIYMPYGLIYSTFRSVDFTGFDRFCIYADSSWLLLLDDINISYCDYGILAIATNSFKITNSNFSYIRKIAVIAGSGNPVVQGCSLDIIGECAIALGSAAKGAIVKGNYFEHASCDGINLTIPNSETAISDIHPCVIVTGASVNSFKNSHLMAAAYVCSAAIEDNYIDGTENVSNKYFVIASGLVNSRIIGTTCKSGDERIVLGVLVGHALSKTNNIEITGNRNTDGGLFEKIGVLYYDTHILPGSKGIYNIYTNDVDDSSFLSGNLMNNLFLYAPANKVVKETTTKYRGFTTFTTSDSDVELRVNSVYYKESTPYNSFDINLLQGKIVYTIWYSKEANSNEWVFNSSYNLSKALAYIPVPVNGLVTMPCVYIAGENIGSSNSEILPIAVDRDLEPYPNIHYLPFRKIRVLDNKYSDSAVIVYEDNDIDRTPSINAILRTSNISKTELAFSLARVGNKYKGINVLDGNKPIWWNGTAWIDADGIALTNVTKTKGSTTEMHQLEPNLTSANNGLRFFDTSENKWYTFNSANGHMRFEDDKGYYPGIHKGGTAARTALTASLGDYDEGYDFYDTDANMIYYFGFDNDTKVWRDAAGNIEH